VKAVVVLSPKAPVAVTEYSATNQFGSENESVIAPSASATTSTSRLQELPASSLILRCTDSPGAQPEPRRVTVAPGR
jgi:hypothetical protein